MKSGWLAHGPKTKEFEQKFAKLCNAKHAVAVNSATAALHLCLLSKGLGKGDEVMIATGLGQSIRFKESDIREMGRSAGGVRGIKLSKKDEVIGSRTIKNANNYNKNYPALAILRDNYEKIKAAAEKLEHSDEKIKIRIITIIVNDIPIISIPTCLFSMN